MKSKWMQALSIQFEQACERYPDERLMLLLDIDGTVLDMRHMNPAGWEERVTEAKVAGGTALPASKLSCLCHC